MIPTNLMKQVEKMMDSKYAERFTKYVMSEFASKSVANARSLLKYSDELVDQIILQENKRKNELAHTVKMLMFQRSIESLPKGYDPGVMFSVMLPVCKTIYPKGNANGYSVAQQKYFDKFCDLLKNEKAFSWDNDYCWLEQEGYADYIKLVMENMSKTKGDNANG